MRRVAVIGAIGPHKGSDLLRRCAEDALARRLPLRFVLVGHSDNESDLRPLPTVEITGRYQEHQIYDLLRDRVCHLSLFLSVWPETFNYVLSIALQARLFPVGFDFGAIDRRSREAGWGEVLSLAWMREPALINDRLCAVAITPPPPLSVPDSRQLYPRFLEDYYGRVFE